MWRHVSNSVFVQNYRQRRYTCITVISLFVILFAFFIAFASFGGPAALPSLKLVHVVFRHGDSTPTFSYPSDPHSHHVWKEGKGALTNKGKLELFELGKLIRNRYDHLLGEFYDPEVHYMESSYAPRCQMSAQTFLAGLFPPKGFQIWNNDLQWQPIPVNPIPTAQDNKIASTAKCPRFEEEKRKVDADLNNKLTKDLKDTLKTVSEHAGTPITNVSLAESLYFTLKSQRENQLKLPSWADEAMPKLAEMAAMSLASFSNTTLLRRLHTGPILKEWVDNMGRAEKSKRKANFYSGHDLTMVALMDSLGQDRLDLPEYGAALVIEYHETSDGSSNFIQMYYFKNALHPTPFPVRISTCENDCTLDEFTKFVVDYISWNDWYAECNNKTTKG